jgi:ABC-type transporter Mla subunit MlaD
MHGPSLLDTRLAEIDRELSRIQTGLDADETQNAVGRSRAGEADSLIAQLRALTDAYERTLKRVDRAAAKVTVNAGPFPDMQALRGFERALAGLDGVAAVRVREFAGDDHVVLDVTLSS